jgi:hypothetical protein
VADLDEIKARVRRGAFEFTQHAVDQALLRHIAVREVRDAVEAAEVIEDYPNDKYGPSCLLLGFTATARPLHVQVSHSTRPIIKVITVYEPDPDRWIEHRYRRTRNDE